MAIRIHLFISHSWQYSDHYNKLHEWIFDNDWTVKSNQIKLNFQNHSIPKDDPVHTNGTVHELKKAITSKIKLCDVVVIPTGMYANYSKWIQKEIDISKDNSKSILSISPWAQERQSSIVREASDSHVGWNKQSVVEGIWNLYNQD